MPALARPRSWSLPAAPATANRRRGAFTLLEVMVALTILMTAMALTLTAYLAALKRAVHSQNTLQGTQQLRYASDLISEAVRSASQTPVVQSGGTQLLVAPKDLGYAVVEEITWIDTLHNVKGSKSNQRVIKVSDATPAAVTLSLFNSTARPSGAVSSGDIATYFIDGTSLPATNLTDLFTVGDSVTIPATAYGASVTRVINSISNNAGTKTITFTADLGVDVPNGTRLLATSGRRLLFSLESNGDLRFYPDHRNLTGYRILARDIDPSPLIDPSNTGSGDTVPFALSGRTLTINLQELPRGTTAGRTVQGVQTTVFTRTDPLAP